MEILPEPTSNKFCDFLTAAAVNRWQVEVNATCSYPTDICKDIMKAQVHASKDFRYSDTARLPGNDEVLKLTSFKKDGLFKLSRQRMV
ncbi:hypothetical protein Tco_0997210 [Tanacetum coccineum]